MKNKFLLIPLFTFVFCFSALAQQKVRDNTIRRGSILPDKDALLELESTNKGLLITRVPLKKTDDAAPLSQHRVGMVVYNTATANDVVPGIYYNNGSRWVLVAAIDDVKPTNYNPVTYELTFINGDGETQVVNLEEVVKATETVTTLAYDSSTHLLNYTDEDSVAHAFDLNVGALTYNDQTHVLTYTNEKGTATSVPLNNTSLTYDPSSGTLRYVNTLGQLEEFDFSNMVDQLETVTALSYDSDTHILTYVDEDRNTHTFNLDVGQLAYDNVTNTLAYTAEDGTVLTIPLNGTGLVYDATTGVLTYTNSRGQAQTVDLSDIVTALETVTELTYDASAHELEYVDEDGTPHTLDLNVGTLAYEPTTNTLTYTAEDGTPTDIPLNNTDLSYDPADGELTYLNSLGVPQVIDLSDIVTALETVTELTYDASAHELEYVDEDGTPHTLDLNVGTLAYEPTTNTLTYTAEDGTPTDIPLNNTDLSYDPADGELTYLNSLGVPQVIDLSDIVTALETVTELNSEITTNDDDETVHRLTYTDENGDEQEIDIAAANGLQIDGSSGAIKLGGTLVNEETVIETTAANTLAISGLQPGNPDHDRIVTVDEDGVLKTVSSNKFVRFFYMPSVIFDTSLEDDDLERDLYQEYIDQFTEIDANLRSTGAPPSIPHIPDRKELYYYITYYDDEVFNIQGINEDGILTYDIIGSGTPMSFMNIVFVIKGEENED
ncbi:hypothetical protein [Parapedobacter sp. DT-150]|uniref:hypothetical protein n=1 Tax=Parapedobacter sp. DT-150 TaxID=3396162 RepID=UPI003F1E0452